MASAIALRAAVPDQNTQKCPAWSPVNDLRSSRGSGTSSNPPKHADNINLLTNMTFVVKSGFKLAKTCLIVCAHFVDFARASHRLFLVKRDDHKNTYYSHIQRSPRN